MTVPYNPPPALQSRFIEEALSPSRTTSMPKAFDFSAFFSSPGLSALRSQQTSSSHPPASEQWIGFTYLPEPEDLSSSLFRHAALAQTVEGSSPAVLNRFLTPARPPSRSMSKSSTVASGLTSTKKRRPLTDLEAFNEVLEYGVLSVKRRQTRASPHPFSASSKVTTAKPDDTPITVRQSTAAAAAPASQQHPLERSQVDLSETPGTVTHLSTTPQQQEGSHTSPERPHRDTVATSAEQEGTKSVRGLRERHQGLLEQCDELEATYQRLFQLALRGSNSSR